MIKRVVLHGYLRELGAGKVVEVNAATAKEAIEMMCAVTGATFAPNPKAGRHALSILGFETEQALYEFTDVEEIHAVPAFVSGKSKFLGIILGVVLIAASFFIPGGWTIAGVAIKGTIFGIGASLVLGGVLQFLMPQPKIDTDGNQVDNSKYLGPPGNTVRIGTRRGIGFGTYKLFGQILSYNVDAKDYSAGEVGGTPSGSAQLGIGGNITWWNANVHV